MKASELIKLGMVLKGKEKISGIYIIYCLASEKAYIGSSTHIIRRWWDHKSRLNSGEHPNKHLLNAWNKYGKDKFIFFLLQESKGDLIEFEKEWFYKLDPSDRYNLVEPLIGVTPGSKLSEYHRKRISEGRKGIKFTDEHKKHISVSKTGIFASKETRLKMSLVHKGRPCSDETKRKISEKAKGRKLSEEHKKKIGLANKAKGS